MRKLKIGIMELLSDSISQNWGKRYYGMRFKRHYASIMPQAVAVWCRQLGHKVTYTTYYGQKDPQELLPDQLDVVFIATYTHASAAAYALAKLYRRANTLTVIGGPHARSFPADCLRFFDLVVQDCDKALIEDILRGSFGRKTIVSSDRALTDVPSVQERLPDIIKSSLTGGQRPLASNIPLLSSVGCPYACDFCVDWSTPYALLSQDQLKADLHFISEKFPGVFVSYHDPMFGVQFDQTMKVLESLGEKGRNPYIMESSLSILKGPRLKRLKQTNCFYAAPGVESWSDYRNKAGAGSSAGWEKLTRVVDHFQEIHEYIPNIQANFIFGSDVDKGDEPVEMTREFIRRVPFVWPTINIPTPFGRTPLYKNYLSEGRILTSMPFSFYYMPYLVMTLKNYHPLEYYDRLIEIYSSANSYKMMKRRIASTRDRTLKILYVLRTFAFQGVLAKLKRTRKRLKEDEEFRSFHEGRTGKLPSFYRRLYAKRLGRFSELISEAEMTPDLTPLSRISSVLQTRTNPGLAVPRHT